MFTFMLMFTFFNVDCAHGDVNNYIYVNVYVDVKIDVDIDVHAIVYVRHSSWHLHLC